MKLFELQPHPDFPEYYDLCQRTGACFYKKAETREYSDEYFMEEFKAQYNKTYYEDEPNLRALARKRLEILSSKTSLKGKKLLEIGCAAGFFLSEAKKLGMEVEGVEISRSEVLFARNLDLKVSNMSFYEWESTDKFDIVCAFFVIEHFADQELVLNKILSNLNPGGMIFLGLPSLYGPSFVTNPKDWFSNHPKDHFVDYSPSSIKKVFQKLDFQLLYRGPMSYHPGRDLGWRGKFPIKYLYRKLADWTCYGDTMHILVKAN